MLHKHHSTETFGSYPPLRILHVAAPPKFGGLQRVVAALAGGQAGRGHDVHVMVVLDEGEDEHPFLGALRGTGVNVLPLRLPPRAYLRERARLLELCRRLEPHVVHTHGYRPDVVDGCVARRLGIPVVSTVHGFTGGGPRNRLYESLQRRALRHCNAVVAVSATLGESLAAGGVSRARLHLLQNAWAGDVDFLPRTHARQSLAVGDDRFHVGWVGRLSHEKGADVCLEAVARLGDVPIRASIIGDGRERAALEARIQQLGLGDRFLLHGMVEDAARYFPGFDVFVLSSRTEGTPIVLFEAMAAGVPIVATCVGGVPDVLTAEVAWLVPPDDPLGLAEAVRLVWRSPHEAQRRVAEACSLLSTRFALDPWLAAYDRVYWQASR